VVRRTPLKTGEDESRCNKKIEGERNGIILVSDITYDTCGILVGDPDNKK